MELLRKSELHELKQKFASAPVVAILGPRQCGKTTLAHQFVRPLPQKKVHLFDLENPRDLSKLENPMLALENLTGWVVLDEIQRRPELFPVLRVLVDRKRRVKFLILGSAAPDLLKQSSETLAGRISFLELEGFSFDEVAESDWKKLWLRGGFPRSYLAKSESLSCEWRREFISTYLERDLPNLGFRIPSATLRRFWTMLSHYHGQILNASELGRSFGISDMTVRHYLEILSGTFMVRLLQPWFLNTGKRLVKRPKVYLRDSGLLHTLMAIENFSALSDHPKLGASWEGFALEQAIQHLNLRSEEVFFWAAHTGAELDLLFQKKGKFWGIEVKYSDAPTLTKSMHSAIEELSLAHLWVLYPGKESYKLDKNISVISLLNLKRIF